MTATPASARLLRDCLRHARGALARSIGSAVVRQAAFLALPWLLGRAVDAGVQQGSVPAAAGWAAAFAVVACVEYAGLCGWMRYANVADAEVGRWLRARLLRAVLAADADVEAGGFGDLTTRATRDVEAVVIWVHGLPSWVVIGITGVVLVPGMAALDPLLLAVAAATVPVLVVVNRVFPRRFGDRAQALARAHAARGAAVEELLTALLPLRGVGADRVVAERHHRRSGEVTRATLRLARAGSLWEAAAYAVPMAAVGIGLLAGGLAVADGRLTPGALTTFVLWMSTVSVATGVLVARLGDRAQAKVAASRVAEVLAADRPRTGTALPATGDLRVRELAVHRPDRTPLGPLTLDAAPGEWIALTGPTGSGKSTLLRAIAGLTPSSGRVSFGGTPIADADPETVHRTVTLVPQNPLLLSGTVRDNLLLAGEFTEAELARAATAAGLDLALAGLADGWDTQVGDRGGGLSGGQRRLVALARALLLDSPVLLLDDVTSALDADTEKQVLDRLRDATRDRVVVFASHSPAVRALADREVALAVRDPGRVTQEA